MISDNLARARHRACLWLACTCAAVSVPAGAAIVTPSTSVTVTKTYAYTALDSGDFVFSTSVEATGCSTGWYIAGTDAGFKSAVATVLAAQISGSFIIVYGDNTQIWSGSPSGQYCHVQAVGIIS